MCVRCLCSTPASALAVRGGVAAISWHLASRPVALPHTKGYCRRSSASGAWWLKLWASNYTTSAAGTQLNSGSVTFYVAVYVSISVTTCIASAVQALVLYSGGMNASRTLYKKMTYAVLRAPLRWVDTVPTGQILNAFISDFNTIDQRLALDFGFLLEFFFRLVIISAAR